MKIDLRNLPEEGLRLEGTEPASFFALSEKDSIRAVSPMTYDLLVMKDDDGLLVTGHLTATFEVECGRCTEKFLQKIDLPHYGTDIPIENDLPVDLTDPIREDILLALPNHPRCEDGNVQPRECPAEGRFEAAPTAVVDPEPHEESDQRVWEALDQLQNLKSN